MDRRSLPFGLAVVALVLLWVVAVPRLDRATAYDDEVRAGEQFALTESIVFTPAVGWEVTGGYRVDPGASAQQSGPVRLSSRGVAIVLSSGDFSGTPDALLSQIDKITTRLTDGEGFHVSQRRVSLTTKMGDVGIAQGFASARASGFIAALVLGGTGVEVQVVGPPDQIAAVGDEVSAMVESIHATDGATS
ncbi:hypothetical protein IEZ26_21240 [Nocardioides cavernae]|uniref:DUF1795 domain-containing protein n=1 Tax=Nocardioides cavernae TaxID=1921566 RepID=A0ABR8NH38_9ACTN|nr:hypothetical protein [Nocardioides cavernae]MBD3927160.1 hypothetical protein [Nocardioides cavernae]MBM7512880.1 hypothetical protein [Nocardioides cavernae]